MNTKLLLIISLFLSLITQASHARDSIQAFSVNEALSTSDAKAKLDPSIKIYFKGQKHPAIAKNFGEYKTNKKTNAFNKSDKVACEWVFLSAMLTLQARAKDLGANAIINVRSNYKSHEFTSASEYQCGAGNVVAGAAFIADIAKTK